MRNSRSSPDPFGSSFTYRPGRPQRPAPSPRPAEPETQDSPQEAEQPAQKPKQTFIDWAGSPKGTLAMVFTDIIGSTALGNELGDEEMNAVRRAHFARARALIEELSGHPIKTNGDEVIAAFRTAVDALDYALALHADAGHPKIRIRAGIHVGPIVIEQNEPHGTTVNYTARVVSVAKGPEIWLSNEARKHILQEGAKRHTQLQWRASTNCLLKGFQGRQVLWSVLR